MFISYIYFILKSQDVVFVHSVELVVGGFVDGNIDILGHLAR
jgi:hypothetical protein